MIIMIYNCNEKGKVNHKICLFQVLPEVCFTSGSFTVLLIVLAASVATYNSFL